MIETASLFKKFINEYIFLENFAPEARVYKPVQYRASPTGGAPLKKIHDFLKSSGCLLADLFHILPQIRTASA